MTTRINGPGVGLPVPQSLYPSALRNAPVTPGTNVQTLPAGGALPIPAGEWLVGLGRYSLLQDLDPVTGTWVVSEYSAYRGQLIPIFSDGFTRRVANLTGCPVAAVVTNGGTGYVQASTTITASLGNSEWQAVVGGAVGTIVVSTASLGAGSGYSIAPDVFIPAPPSPGVQATAVATVSSGTISGISVVNAGAGYVTAPSITILPNPLDPNFEDGTVQNYGIATATLTGSGIIKAVLCTNPGTPVTACPSLTIGGAGASGAATAVWLTTVSASSVVGAGAGYAAPVKLTTVGGRCTATDATNNPRISLTNFVPRQVDAYLTLGTGAVTAINFLDNGMFTASADPSLLISQNPTTAASGVTTAAALTVTLGAATDTVIMQPT
jgi:hypothetical protein